MPEADTGAPRFAQPIWTGRYELEPTSGVTFDDVTVMLSKQLMVQLTGDAENVTAGEVFATLPSECLPDHAVMLPVVCEGKGSSVTATFKTSGGASRATAEFTPSEPSLTGTFEIAAQVDLPVTMEQGAATATASVPETEATGSVTIDASEATGTVTVPAGTATGTATVPASTGTGTATVPASKAAGSIDVSRDVAPMVFVGYDEDGIPNSAYSADLVNNTEGEMAFEADVPSASVPLSVSVPSKSAPVSVSVPSRDVSATLDVPAQTKGVTVSVPAREVDVSVSVPKPTGTVDVPGSSGTVSVDVPTMSGEVSIDAGLMLEGTIDIPTTSSIAILTVSPVGEMKCNMSGTVHLNGISFHLCANYY